MMSYVFNSQRVIRHSCPAVYLWKMLIHDKNNFFQLRKYSLFFEKPDWTEIPHKEKLEAVDMFLFLFSKQLILTVKYWNFSALSHSGDYHHHKLKSSIRDSRT